MSRDHRVTAWVSKYAMSTGLFQVTGHLSPNFPNMLSDCKKVGGDGKELCWCLHGKEWHLRKEDAIEDAIRRIEAKIKSVDKQRMKLAKALQDLKG